MQGPREIASDVYGLGSRMVNWYLVEDAGKLTAVDAGLSGFSKILDDDLRAIGHEPSDIEALVLTHSDADHTGLAPTLQKAGAKVLIHGGDEETLRKPGPKKGDASPIHILPSLWRPQVWQLFIHLGREGGARPPKVEGAETFSAGELLDVPGRPRVITTHGHTPGHCAIHFESKGALFVGDAMCTWNPFTGRTGAQLMPAALNVSNAQALQSLGEIEGVEAEALLVGHGEPWRDGPAAAVAQARERAG
jgi:glyoxylase-like metal-dependent hydrolase (beta-lactamase superfamily II)